MELIIGSVNIDFDCLASMVAVQKLYPKAKLCLLSSQEKNVRQYLKFYSERFAFIKEGKVVLEDITRLIVVDTNHADRLGRFAELAQSKRVSVHIYDHHPPIANQLRGELEVIRQVGATTTVLVQLLHQQRIAINPFEATLFAIGIYEDTGNFLHVSTTAEDLWAAAYLLSHDANLREVKRFTLHKDITLEQIELLNNLLHHTEMVMIHGMEIAIATAEAGVYIDEITLVIKKMEELKNYLALFILVEMGNRVWIVGRSAIQTVNVGKVMEKFGGGGHESAASANISEVSLEEARTQLLQILEETVLPVLKARDIMSTPVDAVTEGITISELKERMLMLHHKYACVLDSAENLVGIVSKSDISRAQMQSMGKKKIRVCMTAKVFTAHPDTTYFELQNLMVRHKIGCIPIQENDKTIGIVTREDLMNAAARMNFHQATRESASRIEFENATHLLEERVPQKCMELIRHLGLAGDDLGMGIYLVGGFVRDLFLKRQNFDMDIVSEGEAYTFAKHFVEKFGGTYKAFAQFRTATITLPKELTDGHPAKVDIATARQEHYKTPASLPIVESSVIRRDLCRRDFSINAIAVQINPSHFGLVIDIFGGQRSLHEGVLKVLHNISFYDDPTRMLRAVRFEQRFNFKIDESTEELLKAVAEDRILNRASPSRIREEFEAILTEEKPYLALKRLHEFKILTQIHPRLVCDDDLYYLFEEIQQILVWFEREFPAEKIDKWQVYLFGLVARMRPREAETFGSKFHWSRHVRERITELMNSRDEIISVLVYDDSATHSRIYNYLHHHAIEVLLYLMADSDKIAEARISLYLRELRWIKLDINGRDLLNLGVPPGPMIGKILRETHYQKLDGVILTREAQLECARQILTAPHPVQDAAQNEPCDGDNDDDDEEQTLQDEAGLDASVEPAISH